LFKKLTVSCFRVPEKLIELLSVSHRNYAFFNIGSQLIQIITPIIQKPSDSFISLKAQPAINSA